MKQKWTTPGGSVNSLFCDMLEQPHVLIAGATGSGKSVVINGLIYTAIHRFPFDRAGGAQLILIDPKRVELSKYRRLPHCIRYASEDAEMVEALEAAMEITETRYKVMQRQGIDHYQGGKVYVIIDELADLMTTNKKQVQPLLQRLGQIGRAANVHMIAATQCPLAKVIPTEIKVNFAAILGLRTATRQHSRNIIDLPGCEEFPDPREEGKAYGAYRKGANLDIYTLPMVPPDEISRISKWWMDQIPTGPLARLRSLLSGSKTA